MTTLLTALLTAGAIDGALVAKPSDDPARAVEGRGHGRDERRGAAGGRGLVLQPDHGARGARPRGRRAAGGPPHRAWSARRARSRDCARCSLRPWPTGAHRVDAVSLTIALFCTKCFDYEALVVRELARTRGIDLDEVARIDVTRGRFTVDDVHGRRVVDEPVRAFLGAALKGCNECADFAGRAADLSVGSVGSADGWTTVLVRTPRGRAMLDVARASFEVADLHDADALLRLDALNASIARRTLGRELDPAGPLFIEYGEHPTPQPLTRTPVVVGRC